MENPLSVGEAAKMLNCKRGTIHSRILRGQIPAEKDAFGEWRIEESCILQIQNWGRPFGTVMRILRKHGINPLHYYS